MNRSHCIHYRSHRDVVFPRCAGSARLFGTAFRVDDEDLDDDVDEDDEFENDDEDGDDEEEDEDDEDVPETWQVAPPAPLRVLTPRVPA